MILLNQKTLFSGNVSGGNVQVGDHNVINQREQRVLSESDKMKLLGKIDNLIILNHLPKDIKITSNYPMSSEEAERYSIEIDNYLLSQGYNVTNSGPSMGNEPLGFITRYVSNQIQIDVGMKDVGTGKL